MNIHMRECSGWPGTCYVAQGDLKLVICNSPASAFWDDSHIAPCPF